VSECPRMASPLLGVVAFVFGALLFIVGFLELSICGGNALFVFGLGIVLFGIGAAMFGGVLVLYPTAFLSAILIIAALVTSNGATGCWF
jgi:hypothetical protein